jgi:hypothetical protein
MDSSQSSNHFLLVFWTNRFPQSNNPLTTTVSSGRFTMSVFESSQIILSDFDLTVNSRVNPVTKLQRGTFELRHHQLFIFTFAILTPEIL